MPNVALKSLGSWRLATRRPHARNFITLSDMWMAILMLYLPALYFYRNNGSVLVTVVANLCSYVFIVLPIFLLELLIGSFSNGSLTSAYNYNRLARAGLCLTFLHQFQNLLAGTSNAHKITTFAVTFFLQNMNPHVSLWDCTNPWNTDSCCSLLAALNGTEGNNKLRARCSTPLEEFYKHYGNILHSGVHVPSSSTYDGGLASLVVWILIAVFLLLISQLSFRDAIRTVTYLITVPSLLLLLLQYLHCFMQPMTGAKINNIITRRDNFRDEYLFTFCMPNLYHVNHIMVAGGYLVVLHCCRKPHRNDRQLKRLLSKNLIILAVCMIAYKSVVCVLRHGTVGITDDLRKRLAGLHGSIEREKRRDLFEDSKDWLYQSLFDAIETVYIMRQEFQSMSSLMILEGSSMLHPILMALGFIGVRIAIYKTTLEILFQSVGYSELLSGPWQMLTRVSLPLSLLAINLAADSNLCRDFLFPKEPLGVAFCLLNVAAFFPSFIYASVAQKLGRMGHSLHWRMMEFALRFKRRLTVIGLLAGFHVGGAQIYKNVGKRYYQAVLSKNKNNEPNATKTPHINYFFQHEVGVYGQTAQRVFSYSGVTANWVLSDVYLAMIGCFAAIFAFLQSDRVFRFLRNNEGLLHLFFYKPCRCFKYCLEFYIAVIFGNR